MNQEDSVNQDIPVVDARTQGCSLSILSSSCHPGMASLCTCFSWQDRGNNSTCLEGLAWQ